MNADKQALERADRILTGMMDHTGDGGGDWITAAREAVRDALEEVADDGGG